MSADSCERLHFEFVGLAQRRMHANDVLIRDADDGYFRQSAVTEKETCKDDFKCPRGYLNRGDKECRGKCDQEECCERGEYLEDVYVCNAWTWSIDVLDSISPIF